MQENAADQPAERRRHQPPELSVIVPVCNEHQLVGELLQRLAAAPIPSAREVEIIAGDVEHAHADLTSASDLLGYTPSMDLAGGLQR